MLRGVFDSKLTAEDREKARKELGETPETRAAGLEALRRALAKEDRLRSRTDDVFLLRFLRHSKFNVERALRQIISYYKARSENRQFIRMPSEVQQALRSNISSFLPYRDPEGRLLHVVHFGDYNLDTSFEELMAAATCGFIMLMENEVTQMNGAIGIWDFKDFTFKKATALASPSNVWNVNKMVKEMMTLRVPAVYFINCHPIMQASWNIIKPFVPTKIRKRMMITTEGVSALHRYLSPDILSKELGGKLPSFCEEFNQKLTENEKLIAYEDQFGYI